ncbi:MAG: sarcosine oxidase subunit gamma family protein [Alphaproteobacteria bacterium]
MAEAIKTEIRVGDPLFSAGLVSVAFWQNGIDRYGAAFCASLNGELPSSGYVASAYDAGYLFRISRDRLLMQSSHDEALYQRVRAALPDNEAAVSDLSHARQVICLSGPDIPIMLSRCLPVECSNSALPVEHFVQTYLQDAVVLVHRVSAQEYRMIVPTSFADAISTRLQKII